MAVYSAEFKENIVRRLIPPEAQSKAQVSHETEVNTPALYQRKKQFQRDGSMIPHRAPAPDG